LIDRSALAFIRFVTHVDAASNKLFVESDIHNYTITVNKFLVDQSMGEYDFADVYS
jgi:hypothetical protein